VKATEKGLVVGNRFTELTFTPNVKSIQDLNGSRRAYSRAEKGETHHDVLGPGEAAFIGARDSFYMATVGETGWPYIQHRGGPKGFLKVIDERTLAFADFRGNRQYISVGNLQTDARVSLFLMDYPNRERLKILGQAKIVSTTDLETWKTLSHYEATVERGVLIKVAAFDWNCSQHITSRFTPAEFEEIASPLRGPVAALEQGLAEQKPKHSKFDEPGRLR